jgi:hypothetical protein
VVAVTALALGVGLGAIGLAVQACGNGTGVASGGACITAIDCAAGLICLPKTHVCSSNLTSVETMLEGGNDTSAAAPDGGTPVIPTDAAVSTDAPAATDTGTAGSG